MRITALWGKPARLFYGWRIVGAGAAINAIGGGSFFYGFSVFFLPITEALNLARAQTSLVFSLSRLEGGLEGPVAGYLTDKLGPRIMIIAGTLMTGVGYILLSRVGSFTELLLVYLGLVALGANTGLTSAVIVAVNSWFIRHRGLAMALALSGFSLGGAIIAPLISQGIKFFEWRTTMILVGLSYFILIPLALPFRRSPESMGLVPDGGPPTQGPAPSLDATVPLHGGEDRDYTVREAMRSPSYWLLILASMFRLGVIVSLTVHFVAIMVWKGTSIEMGALLLGALAILTIPGRIVFGFMGDRWQKSKVIAVFLLPGIPALLLLAYTQSFWGLWVFIFTYAIADSLGPVNWAIIGDYFGRRSYGTLRGILTFFTSWGGIILPVMAGAIYDRWETYQPTLLVFAGLMAASALVFAIVPKPSPPARAVQKTVS
ncbi:MAG: MFS transporter [Chloroflexi bacterium]|nr:MFS transporter [Chloroflexota bacterium]